MSRQFSMPTVLRMAPKSLLAKVFEELGYFDTKIPWQLMDAHEITPILEYCDGLLPGQRNEIEGVLRSFSDLACSTGYRAIQEAANVCNVFDLAENLSAELSNWGGVIEVWLKYRRVFDRAQLIHQVDRLAWWRRRTDLPQVEPKKSREALNALAAEISKLLKNQGRGQACTIEVMSRDEIVYFFAYPDDFVHNVTQHDEFGRLVAAAVRQTFQVVFAYNQDEGTLDTFVANLTPRDKARMEWIFATTILSHELGKHEPPPAYELDHVKNPSFTPTVDPSDRIKVHIRKVRLAPPNGRRLLLEVEDHDSIHAAMHECLNLVEIPLDRWGVLQVTFGFEFLEKEGRKRGRESVEVGYPRTGGVKSACPERAIVINKYLRRWEIDCVHNVEEDLVEVGVQSADPSSNGDHEHLSGVV